MKATSFSQIFQPDSNDPYPMIIISSE